MESTKMTHTDNTPTPWPYLDPYNTMPAIHTHIPTLESFLFQFPNIISPSYVTPNIQMSPRFQPIFFLLAFFILQPKENSPIIKKKLPWRYRDNI